MTAETERIKKLLKNSWDGSMWHGNNLQEALKGVTWQAAFTKPAGFNHNIFEYVNHMYCWRKFLLEYLNGNYEYTTELNSEQDWICQYEKTETEWKSVLAKLEESQAKLIVAIDKLTDAHLDEMVPGKKFRWYVFVHGLIHHDIYHSAQISILKKAAAI